MLSLSANYEQTFFACVKNSFFLSLGTLPQTVFFGALSVLPFALFFISNVSIVVSAALVCLILFSFSYAILVWLSFTQWVYDRYITPKQKRKTETSKKPEEKKEKSRLTSGEIKPLDDGKEVAELPQSYTRKDLKKIEENKKEMLSDADIQEKTE